MMMRPSHFAMTCVLLISGCEEFTPPVSPTPVAYQPELAGTVDHAMCLLGFKGIPMRTIATGHQLVDGSLNGRAVTLVVDTGANVSVVHAAHADMFGLAPRAGLGGSAIGLGGALRATQSRVGSFEIGGLAIAQPNLMVADLSQLEALLARLSGAPVHGILGQDVMKIHHAVIDAAKPMLYLQEATAIPRPISADLCAAESETPAEPGRP